MHRKQVKIRLLKGARMDYTFLNKTPWKKNCRCKQSFMEPFTMLPFWDSPGFSLFSQGSKIIHWNPMDGISLLRRPPFCALLAKNDAGSSLIALTSSLWVTKRRHGQQRPFPTPFLYFCNVCRLCIFQCGNQSKQGIAFIKRFGSWHPQNSKWWKSSVLD